MSTFRPAALPPESCGPTVNAELTSYPQLFGTQMIECIQCVARDLFSSYPQTVKTVVSHLFATMRRLRGNRTAKRSGKRQPHRRADGRFVVRGVCGRAGLCPSDYANGHGNGQHAVLLPDHEPAA